MTHVPTDGLHAVRALPPAEQAAVEALAARCNAAGGLDLKLNIADPLPPGDTPARFCYYADGRLVGFASLDGTDEVEICGMVAPEARRRGIGSALLAAARAACRAQGAAAALLICEDASAAGRAFVAAHGGALQFAEHHMERPPDAALPAAPGPAVTLRPVGPADVPALAALLAEGFDDPAPERAARIATDMTAPAERYYFAVAAGTPVAALKIVTGGDHAGIYAFTVLPAYRGRGLGRAALVAALALLRAAGIPRIGLEVETDNTPAFRLYEQTGFVTTTTYGYYAIPLDPA